MGRFGHIGIASEVEARRVQRGGFANQEDAVAALQRELERVRRERRVSRNLTLAELVGIYLAQHDVQPVTISKLRWLLDKAIVVFGHRRIGELTSQEIAEWRMKLSPGYRFEATQALRQVYGHLARDGREHAIRLLDELSAEQARHRPRGAGRLWRSIIVRLAPMKRERSKVEMPARSAKVAKVCRRS